MNRRVYVALFLVALAVNLLIANYQPFPGYLDADYYFAGGLQLVAGRGFNEPYLWNYLDDPVSLPHPSHAYWMPLASIVAALGMFVTGVHTYAAARLGFILLAALVPPLTARLAYTFSARNDLAITSGVLAIFSVFHLTFMPVTDNYPIYMILGGLYFLVMTRGRPWFWLGLLSGLMTLARSDGLIWLALSLVLVFFPRKRSDSEPARLGAPRMSIDAFVSALYTLLGFMLIMGPWYARNFAVYGSLMAPGGSRVLWTTSYDETFMYPASQLTLEHWLEAGWDSILRVRLWALGNNLQSMIAAQGHLILFPLIMAGMWQHRADRRIQIALVAWFGLFLVMTMVFPFAGVRGSFFHAGAALQPLFWSLAPVGLERAVAWLAQKRRWMVKQAQVVFRLAMVQMIILLSAYLVWFRIFERGWGEGEALYPKVEKFLQEEGIQPGEPVIVLNPAAYYITTDRPALVQPYGGPSTTLAVAQQFGARYFVFESQGRLEPLKALYDDPLVHEHFLYLGEIDGARIFELEPGE